MARTYARDRIGRFAAGAASSASRASTASARRGQNRLRAAARVGAHTIPSGYGKSAKRGHYAGGIERHGNVTKWSGMATKQSPGPIVRTSTGRSATKGVSMRQAYTGKAPRGKVAMRARYNAPVRRSGKR